MLEEWKIKESSLNQNKIRELENKLNCTLPEYQRLIIKYDISQIELFSVILGDRISDTIKYVKELNFKSNSQEVRNLMAKKGLVAFAEDLDLLSPVCFDTQNEKSTEYKIVILDAEDCSILGPINKDLSKFLESQIFLKKIYKREINKKNRSKKLSKEIKDSLHDIDEITRSKMGSKYWDSKIESFNDL